jgi:hypothetical protein
MYVDLDEDQSGTPDNVIVPPIAAEMGSPRTPGTRPPISIPNVCVAPKVEVILVDSVGKRGILDKPV